MKVTLTSDMIIAAPGLLRALKEIVEELYNLYDEEPKSGRFRQYEDLIKKAEGEEPIVEPNYKFEVELYAVGKDPNEAWDKAQAYAAEYGLPKWSDYAFIGKK